MPPREATPLTFYPAYCFPSSVTYFAWAKLTAHDIHHTLRSRPGFAASTSKSELLFYLNHPIQFVQVVGVVVGYDDQFEKLWSVTLDDGSGEVVECVCWKEVKMKNGAADGNGEKKEIDPEQAKRELVLKSIDVGATLLVKGTISSFRSVRQITIERLVVIPSTNHEVVAIAARNKYLEEVLSKPWVVSSGRQKRMYKQAQGKKRKEGEDGRKVRERLERLREREVRHARKIAEEWEEQEERRREDAEDAREAGREVQMQIQVQKQKLKEVVSDDFADLTY